MARMASATAAAVLQQHADGLQAKLYAAEQQLRCGVQICCVSVDHEAVGRPGTMKIPDSAPQNWFCCLR